MTGKKPAMHKATPHKAAMPKPGSDSHYRAQSDMHALKEAAAIKSDPARHGAAKELAKQEVAHLRKVAGRTTSK